jgi:hypothetical protein
VGAGISAGVGIEVQAPVIEVGVPGVIIETDHHHHHGKFKRFKHGKGKFRRFH